MRYKVQWMFAAVGAVCLGAAAVGMSQSGLAVPSNPTPQDLSVSFRSVADQVLPAVVSISTETKAREITSGNGTPGVSPFEDRFFKEFFGDDPRFNEMFRNQQRQRRQMPKQQGWGSGFIIDSEGIILTNSHVVEGADEVTVRLYDGREYEAESWNYDPRTDIAVVRIKPENKLPFVSLGDSDQTQIGDWVLAMGNPFRVGTTVTAGIISATSRGPGINEREEYLQTDAAINPGNSGGPLVNLRGEVVGINTAISTRSGGYDGIGFAIPAKMVSWVSEQLIKDGTVNRSYLGVALQAMGNDIREQFGLGLREGALISDVRPDTPAEKAGLQVGDIILRFNKRDIEDSEDLVDVVERSVPDKDYPVVILRDNKRQTINVKLEPMPKDYTPALQRAFGNDDQAEESTPEPQEVEVEKLGMEVSELTDDLSQQLGLDDKVDGIVVTSVKGGSPAAEAGLSSGDIIQRVGTKPVKSVDQFRQAVKDANLDRGLLLHIKRANGSAFVVIKAD